MGMFQKIAKLFETPAGEVRDTGGVRLPADETLKGEIMVIPSHVPGVEFGFGLSPFGPAVLGYDVRLEDGEEIQRRTLSEEGRERLLAEFNAQIESDGKITRFPDLSDFDDSPSRHA